MGTEDFLLMLSFFVLAAVLLWIVSPGDYREWDRMEKEIAKRNQALEIAKLEHSTGIVQLGVNEDHCQDCWKTRKEHRND